MRDNNDPKFSRTLENKGRVKISQVVAVKSAEAVCAAISSVQALRTPDVAPTQNYDACGRLHGGSIQGSSSRNIAARL